MATSDLNLVKRIQNGDKSAFKDLVERYQNKLFSIAFGMVRQREDAMDLVQEAFLKAYRNLDKFEGTSAFYTWLYRITVNVCIDHIRKIKKRYEVDYDDQKLVDSKIVGENTLLPSTLGINPDHNLRRKELLEQIDKALEKLSPNHRQAIILREIHGLSYDEIADVLDVSKGTVMSRLHHARKNLQTQLKAYASNNGHIGPG